MAEPMSLFAIEVYTTKEGRQRKRRAWEGVHRLAPRPSVIYDDPCEAEDNLSEAEEKFCCFCRVVEFVEVVE